MRLKFTFFAVMMMAMAVPKFATSQEDHFPIFDFWAQAPTGQTLFYRIVDGTAHVTAPFGGAYLHYTPFDEPSGNLVVPGSVTYNGTTYAVTEIDEDAFRYSEDLTSVTFSEGVQYVWDAFEFCRKLKSITFASSVIEASMTLEPDSLSTINILASHMWWGNLVFGYHAPAKLTINIPCGSWDWYAYYSLPYHINRLREPYAEMWMTVNSADSSRGSARIILQHNDFVRCDDSSTIIIAEAEEHYHFDHWSNGRTVNPDTLYLIGDSIVTAIFAPDQYTLTVNSDNEYSGSTSGGGVYDYLDTTYAIATPVPHYHFLNWNDGIADNPRQIVITDDISFTAFFAPDTHTINVMAENDYGSVTGGGQYTYGSSCTVQATAFPGHTFRGWMNGNTDNPYTFTVTGDVTLTALFDEEEPTYTITAISADVSSGNVTGGGTYTQGSTIQIEAMAYFGYHFAQWQDGITDNPRTITVTGNATYTATFAQNSSTVYTVLVNPDDETKGTALGGGTYTLGQTVSIAAYAKHGFRFAHWQDNETANPRVITVTGDASYTAFFEDDTYTIIAVPEDSSMGLVEGSGTYYAKTMVTVRAIAEQGYRFEHWTDGNTENPRSIRLVSNVFLTGYFVPAIRDTLFVVDTTVLDTIVVVENRVGDTLFIHQTKVVRGTVWDSTYVPASGAIVMNDTVYVTIVDTAFVDVYEHDTTYIEVPLHDTAYVNVYVHDTTQIEVPVYDTTQLTIYTRDTTYINVEVRDTVTVTLVDTVTVENYVYDTTFLHDTTLITDTLWLHNTVYIHDTVVITIEGIEDIETLDFKLYHRDGRIVVETVEGVNLPVCIFDAIGRRVAVKEAGCHMTEFEVPASGVYLVKLGTLPARRIVIVK